MNITKKQIGIAVAAVALASVAGVAIAKSADHYRGGHERGFGHGGFGGNISRVARALDLNDEQREATRELVNDIREFRREHRESARESAAALFARDSLSSEEAKTLLSMREQRREEAREFMGGKLSEFHALLTPAQRETAVALWQDRRLGFGHGHRGKRHGHGHRGRGHGHWDDDRHHRRGRDNN